MLPQQLVDVLAQGEIANQEIATYQMQKSGQDQRIETKKAKGTADMQDDLAKSQVGVDIRNNRTAARKCDRWDWRMRKRTNARWPHWGPTLRLWSTPSRHYRGAACRSCPTRW